MVSVRVTPAAIRQLQKLPASMLPRVQTIIDRLTHWPAVSGAKPLRGKRAGQYRIRTGDYRVIIQPRGSEIFVLEIGNRRDIYED